MLGENELFDSQFIDDKCYSLYIVFSRISINFGTSELVKMLAGIEIFFC